MKKLLSVLLLVMFTHVLVAKNEEETKTANYVKTAGKTYFCEKVRPGLFFTNIVMSDGNIMKIPFKNVDSYCCKGRLFERLPVVCEGARANQTALMEYITSRNGLRLYKYSMFSECGDLISSTYKNAHPRFVFFVFKDGEFYLEVDQKNAPTVLPFFGIEVM